MGTYVKLLEKFEKGIEKKGVTITVSGLSGTGKTTFAKKIAEKLNLEYVSAGKIFRDIAKERRMILKEFSKTREEEIDLMIDKKLLGLAQKGGYVLDGRMAGLVAGDYADERVFITAKEEIVSERISKRDGKTLNQAKKDTIERDKADTAKYVEVYGIEPKKSDCYSITIENNGTFKEFLEKINQFIEYINKNDNHNI